MHQTSYKTDNNYNNIVIFSALEKLGYGEYKEEIEEIAKTCKEKRRKQSTRLENLGIPEEELYRQQQELFAKVNMNLIHTSIIHYFL